MMGLKFLDCGSTPLGLYPLVDSIDWIGKLLPLGVSTIQLRIKNKSLPELETIIQKSVELAKQYQARLFINDYWEFAIKYGAYGVHLGQEDLDKADLKKIHEANLRLGVSTHSPAEIERVLRFEPSYLAFGPIFLTQTKDMTFEPQGLEKINYWVRQLPYPIVAIGGINKERLKDVLATGVSGIAMIAAIKEAEDPIALTQFLVKAVGDYQR